MANLTRYLQKIFANNSDEVGVFGTGVNKQVSKNVETLQSAEYEGGWSEAIITNKNYPIWQEMDGVQYGFSYQLAYLLQKGIPEWIATETYYTNDYCRVGSTIYYSLQDNNIGKNPTSETTYWTPLLTSNRSIGQIIPSTIALTEAGLHLLDGSLIQGTGIYADFVTYMANLTATQPDIFTTEATWQSTVTTYGACGKFVYDSVNDTIRLPKIVGIIEGTNDLTKIGNLTRAGLPNITGNIGGIASQSNGTSVSADGAFVARVDVENGGYGTSKANWKDGFNLNASRSSAIYGRSDTVQPQTITVLYYIVVATSTKTDIQVDIDEIITDLNAKADKTEVDGQWVSSYNILASNVSAPTSTDLEYDLSSILPDDDYNYEVLLSGRATTGTVSGNICLVQVSTSLTGNQWISESQTRSSSSVISAGSTIAGVGTDRKVGVVAVSNNTGTFTLFISAYRRIGTNS